MNTAGPIHVFRHHAMKTEFQARISGEEKAYAGQAARAAFEVADRMERLLSRFRDDSDISAIAALTDGTGARVAEPTFACLELARHAEVLTGGAFNIAYLSRLKGNAPEWRLDRETRSVVCLRGPLTFDLGAIGKGFALDRMAEELAEWSCEKYMLVAGGSSVLCGAAPEGRAGWEVRAGSVVETIVDGACGGSGLAVKGEHIRNPRSPDAPLQRKQSWVFAKSAAFSDALSTACMVLDASEIEALRARIADVRIVIPDEPTP